ncbi:MAG: hypothetical protein NC936_05745 [Candidatus Omnitrophica bacterium]|nr:hypothetical protein [Candidatus Omnitrophota bacterium]
MRQNKLNQGLIFIFFLMALCGCSQHIKKTALKEAKITAYLRRETINQAIKNDSIKPGLRRQELITLLGKPDRVIQIETDYHYDEQWIYEDRTGPETKYYSFHFQDDALLEWH